MELVEMPEYNLVGCLLFDKDWKFIGMVDENKLLIRL